MEDVDSPRTKPGADVQALADLRWLGLDWDEGPDVGGPHAPYVQTQRLASYERLLAELKSRDLVYPCTCTRKDVIEAASAPHETGAEPSYPGTCAHRTPDDAERLAAPYCWRLRTAGLSESFDDAIFGPQSAALAAVGGDFVVWKHADAPAYQLAVVADDRAMSVTQVVRGCDLIPSTFRQLCLYRAFGWRPPDFAHTPLVVGPDGRRLAKRHGDTRLATYRAAGVPPERLLGFLAWTAGLQSADRPVRPAELLSAFAFAKVPRTPTIIDADADALRP
jgi:glutamyl-tRNA synthetase